MLGVLLGMLGCTEQSPPSSAGQATVEPAIERVAASPEPRARARDTPPKPPATARAQTLELTFVGDLVLGRYVEFRGQQVFAQLHPPEHDPFADVAPLLAADVVVGNLESPVMVEPPPRSPVDGHYRLAGSAAHLEQLTRGGFTVLSLANNHYYDLGVAGQLEGPQLLADAGLVAIGASRVEPPLLRVETVHAQGWRIGFLAMATLRNHSGAPDGPQLPFATLAQWRSEALPILAAARAKHDLLIVVVHWGSEYVDEVRNANRLAARALLEGGVDLVIGHHPHVLQAIERHRSSDERDGLIAYSLGNFLFPRGDPRPGMSGVLRVRYREGAGDARPCLEEARLHPAHIARDPRWHPEPATGPRGRQVRKRVRELSSGHGTKLVRDQPGEDLLVAGLRACPNATPL